MSPTQLLTFHMDNGNTAPSNILTPESSHHEDRRRGGVLLYGWFILLSYTEQSSLDCNRITWHYCCTKELIRYSRKPNTFTSAYDLDNLWWWSAWSDLITFRPWASFLMWHKYVETKTEWITHLCFHIMVTKWQAREEEIFRNEWSTIH